MNTTVKWLAGLALVLSLGACGTSKSVVTVQEATGITKGQELVDLQRALKDGALTTREYEALRRVIMDRPR